MGDKLFRVIVYMYVVDVACVGGEGGTRIFYLVYRIGEYDVGRHMIYVLAICVYCGA